MPFDGINTIFNQPTIGSVLGTDYVPLWQTAASATKKISFQNMFNLLGSVTIPGLTTSGSVAVGGGLTVAGSLSTGSLNVAAIDGTPIGSVTPSTGVFTTLAATTLSITALNGTPVGNITPSTGNFTTLQAGSINATPIGSAAPSSGVFSTIQANSALTASGPTTLTVPYLSGANPNGLKHVFNFSTSPVNDGANPTVFQTNITATTGGHEIWANFDSTIHNVPGGDIASTGNIVSRYVQAIRYTDSKVPLSALIANAIDATGHSTVLGGPLSALELDITANGADTNNLRRGMEIALGKFDNAGARPEALAAFEIFSGSSTIQDIGGYGFYTLMILSSPFRDAGIDMRGATAWAGAGTGTDMAIRFRSGHKFVWDTGATTFTRFNATTGAMEMSAGGGWASTNNGKQLLLTTPNGFSNPALGITDATGANIWAIINNSGQLRFSQMPALSDSTTAPTDALVLTTAGNTMVNAAAGLARHVYDIRLSGCDVTGSIDAQAVVQSWINTLPKGSTVRIPSEGRVLISSADLAIPPGIAVVGEGATLETTAGIAGGLLFGPAFVLTPTTSILLGSGAALRGIKVLRQGLLSAPTTADVNAAVALWASEATILYTSATAASGTNILTFPSTTGVTVGQLVLMDSVGNSTTVTAVTTTTVTLSTNVAALVGVQTPVRFGRSVAVRVLGSTGGCRLEDVTIVGFNTAIATQSGRLWIDGICSDCTTNLFCVGAGDSSYIQNIHCVGYYGGFTSGVGNNRPGPAFVFGHADGFTVSNVTQVSWVTGFVVANTSGIRFDRCWSEHNFTDGVAICAAYTTRGVVNVVSFEQCTASAASVAFDMQHTGGNVNVLGCITAVVNNATKIGHYRFGASSVGAVTGAMINSNSGTAFVVQPSVGWWKVNGPMLGTFVTSPWITGASSDLAKVELFMVRDQSGTTDSKVQTHLREKVWLSWDSSVAVTDGSPTEPLAVESLSSSTSFAALQSFWHSGTKVGTMFARNSNTVFTMESSSGVDLAFYSTTKHSFYVSGNPALNIQAHASSAATDFVQLGPENTAGAYVALVSPSATAPLNIGTASGGPLNLQSGGGATTVGGSLRVNGNVGFYNTAPIAKQTGVAVTAGAIHAALVNLGLISA